MPAMFNRCPVQCMWVVFKSAINWTRCDAGLLHILSRLKRINRYLHSPIYLYGVVLNKTQEFLYLDACLSTIIKLKIKWSHYRPGVAQRVGRGIALLFHDRGTRRGWVVSSTPRPHVTAGKDPVPIVQEAGWPPGPVWTGGKSRPHRDSIPDRPAHSQSLYRLSYRATYLLL